MSGAPAGAAGTASATARVVAVTTGTSVDGLDVVAADLGLEPGGVLVLTPLGQLAVPLDGGLQARIRALAGGAATTAAEVCAVDVELGAAMARAARAGVGGPAGGRADLVVLLGQTVHHEVRGGAVHGTLQLGRAAPVAEATGLPVVADLRSRDVAAGGQGAPLVSAADVLLLRGLAGPAAHDPAAAEAPEAGAGSADVVGLLNLGGIANLTLIGGDGTPIAFDAGPANALLDLEVQRTTGQPHDRDGSLAAAGRVDEALLAALLDDPYLAAPPPKSTGKERYGAAWLDAALDAAARGGTPAGRTADASPCLEDRLATLVEAVAAAVADQAARQGATRLWASGGGVRNRHLLERLRARLADAGCRLGTTADLGLDPDAKEALAIAVLGWATWHGVPATVPACTGARGARILGSLTPGAQPLRLPPPAEPPRSMRVAGPAGPATGDRGAATGSGRAPAEVRA